MRLKKVRHIPIIVDEKKLGEIIYHKIPNFNSLMNNDEFRSIKI